jgi:hypothetical protein
MGSDIGQVSITNNKLFTKNLSLIPNFSFIIINNSSLMLTEKFVVVTYDSDKSAYSSDGINWTASTLPSSANWSSVIYGNGKFVTVASSSSDKSAYSSDGITWTASTLPSSSSWSSVTYGNGKFVPVAYNSNKSAYSSDGITWTASTLPSSAYWYTLTFSNSVITGGTGGGVGGHQPP